MPYGNRSESTPPLSVTSVFQAPGSAPLTSTNSFGEQFFLEESRSGSNANSGPSPSPGPEQPRSFKEVFIRVPTGGPKSGQRLYDPKRKRWYWKRDYILVKRLIPVKTRRSKPRKGSRLLPNSLSYSKSALVSVQAPQSLTASHVSNGSTMTLSGDLWMPHTSVWAPYTSGTTPPYHSNFAGISSALTALAAEIDTKALSTFYERIKNQHINLAQALAERKKTVETVASIAVSAAKALVALKRGNLTAASKQILPQNSKELSNQWLAYQYGVKPLLMDLEGAAKHLANPEAFEFDIIYSKTEKLPETILHNSSGSLGWKASHQVRTSGTVTVRYKARVKIGSNVRRLSARLGFSNPIGLAYELVPWSFIVDWFIPIGQYLSSLDALEGLSLVYVHKTVFIKETTTCSSVIGGNADGYIWPSATMSWKIEKVSCVRSILTENLPGLSFPSFKNPVSGTHLVTAMALLNQLR